MKTNKKMFAQEFIRDAIHKNININEPVIRELIASKEFQRLRWISQLAGAQVAFPSATHTRFTHSLGVYHVLNRVFSEVKGANLISDKEKLVVRIAGLLHDIGHGPFSHTFEKVLNLNEDKDYPFSHEFYTCAIISDEKTEVNQILKKYHIDINQVTNIIKKDRSKCPKYQIQLVSSQLDCDRIDYLMRDAYFTGAKYGAIDLDWVISNMILDKKEGILFSYKALSAIENYLITRFHMYLQVYFHKSSIFFDLKLQKLFQQLVKLWKENYQWKIDIQKIMPILKQEKIEVSQYLELSDVTLINLIKDIIAYETDETLIIWAKAILYNQEKYKIVLERKKVSSNAKVLNNFIYDTKKDPIMIQTVDNKVLPLEKVSQLFENPTKEQKIFYSLAEIN
ncbi:HD domain-containing protein [Spiroplasma platyhelix]|uniref:HD domain-containing protein n=1 Tax=Spiroplasma platyhelix PALS-1 TaxID=1276218 RepID=A0A846U286_9MOLU|nr:HD domain-containing protein [Spiroplasma platyhelix]MBE4704256.1 Deoxyguanosinetriphosphate triphosphohydrolase-like protein [Spiroplasma platyhelix PALS-1]NKE38629.1 HD domain-containing protein [Spiroplasma platyhelix PALS-1]UJB28840.1 HD superfamily phosphohydrolase [Spiroplasma platyhelix PALS-1]